MTKYQDGELVNLLPPFFSKNPDYIALSYALKMGVKKLLYFAKLTSVYACIDDLPVEILDYLALELNVTYYETSASLSKKRKLIKNAILTKMETGTKYAVDTLCDTIFGSADIIEWFDFTEPDGNEGRFDVELRAVAGSDDLFSRFSYMIEHVKNASSHVRTINETSPINLERLTGVTAWHSPASVADARETEETKE